MIGDKIKELRNRTGLYQQELADIMNVSKSTIAMWETNKREPSSEMLVALANFFEVTTDFLLGVSTDTETNKKDTSLINEVSMILCNFTEEELLDIKKYSNFLRWSRGH